ncbi:MAG: polymer-forming cytoskeletal protein [Oscillospiraceae bacterium]
MNNIDTNFINNNTSIGKTHISEGTVIIGSITSDDDITVRGKVEGDIVTSGDVIIAGYTQGDIKAKCLTVESGTIKGKMDVEDKLDIINADKIEGDIFTNVITVKACSNFTASIKTRNIKE